MNIKKTIIESFPVAFPRNSLLGARNDTSKAILTHLFRTANIDRFDSGEAEKNEKDVSRKADAGKPIYTLNSVKDIENEDEDEDEDDLVNLIAFPLNREQIMALNPIFVGEVDGIKFFKDPLSGDNSELIADTGDEFGKSVIFDLEELEDDEDEDEDDEDEDEEDLDDFIDDYNINDEIVENIYRSMKDASKSNLKEQIKSGPLKLDNGKILNVSPKDAKLLNDFFDDLSFNERKELEKLLVRSEADFKEVLAFAKEV